MLKRARRSPSIWIGGVLVLGLILLAILAPVIGPEGIDNQNLLMRLKPPSAQFLLGTDHLGRSILTRLAFGARYSLQVGVYSVVVSALGGILIGVVAGFYGGWADRVLMGLMDILLAPPSILLAIALVAALGPGLFNVVLAIGIRGIPSYARLLRGQVIAVRNREFVEAAQALGAGDLRIMARHVLPNTLGPIMVLSSLELAGSILTVASLSFLGLGAQPPTPDWGGMIDQGRQFLRSAWWIGVFPGLGIMMTVLGFNLLGDGLQDVLDPRNKR